MNLEPHPSPPRFLYKYMSLDEEEHRSWLRQIVLEHRVWFSNPSKLNDPWESRFRVSLEANSQAELSLRSQWLRENSSHPDPSWSDRMATQFDRDEGMRRIAADEAEKELSRRFRDTYGIYSLAERPDNALMWSHYASSHKGICIEFDTDIPLGAWGPNPVRYSADYPIPRMFVDGDDQIIRLTLLHKSSDWAYEREWRYVLARGSGHVYWSGPAVRTIRLGMQVSKQNAEFVRDLVRSQDAPIRLLYCRRHAEQYRISESEHWPFH